MQEHLIRLQSPATTWEDGIPLGTGRIAAMITGLAGHDLLALNHERLWSNRFAAPRRNASAASELPAIRTLLTQKKYEEATALVNRKFCPTGGISGQPARIDSFLPAGEFRLQWDNITDDQYRRELDLRNGLATIRSGGFRREYFADFAADQIVGKISNIRKMGFSLHFSCPWQFRQTTYNSRTLLLRLRAPDTVDYEIELEFSHPGEWHDGKLVFRSLSELVFSIDLRVGTELVRRPAPSLDWTARLAAHRPVFQSYFAAFSLTLPTDPALSVLPLDTRLARLTEGKADVGLLLLFFNFSRYLLISSSALGTLPPNLQGKWNADPTPPWRSDYHLDINLQMNLWPAEPLRMEWMSKSFFALLERVLPAARQAAQDLWGCRGCWFPWALDLSENATPEGQGWGVSVITAPWLAQHFFTHYEYTQDREFLARCAYPFLKECALFFEDFLMAGDDGLYHLSPSMSPENPFREAGDWPVGIATDCAGELAVVAELLENAISAATILNCDPERQQRWAELRQQLPTPKIGLDGRLMEWGDEVTETEPGHRHLSHLYALFPGQKIDAQQTPSLYAAARTSLAARLAASEIRTGWSVAWACCALAAVRDGDAALAGLYQILLKHCSTSLLGLHPPRIFQIDGNAGAITAILALLFHSGNDVLEPLPALPSEWSDGAVTGLAVRGGYTVDMTWRNGMLRQILIQSSRTGCYQLTYRGYSVKRMVEAGEEYRWQFYLATGFNVISVRRGGIRPANDHNDGGTP